MPWNKLRGSTNFIIFGPLDQKLWMFENLEKFREVWTGRAYAGANQQELTTSTQKGGQQE